MPSGAGPTAAGMSCAPERRSSGHERQLRQSIKSTNVRLRVQRDISRVLSSSGMAAAALAEALPFFCALASSSAFAWCRPEPATDRNGRVLLDRLAQLSSMLS